MSKKSKKVSAKAQDPQGKRTFIFSRKKKLFFYSVLITIPILVIILFELFLRIISYGDDLNLFIPSAEPEYLRCNPVVGKRFFSKFDYPVPLNDLFLKEKPSSGFRIFVLGESTVQGFPYDPNSAFSRILNRQLTDFFPERTIEIINLGLTAVNSFTLLDFIDEVIEQKPDLVLIYTGHNEYYGALGVGSMENGSISPVFKKMHLFFIHFKTYQLLQNFIKDIYGSLYPMSSEEAKGTLMQQIVGKNIIPFGSPMYKDGLVQFKNNMGELLTRLKQSGIPVIISDQVSNEKDLVPFHSVKYKNFPRADSVFFRGKKLESLSSFAEAKVEYLKAKDLDCIRFRASEDLNRLIFNLADSLNVYKISMKDFFGNNSQHEITGNELMTEHLHPNIDGYFLMAGCFFKAIIENDLIEKNDDTTASYSWIYNRNSWGFTKLDSMIADLRIKQLRAGWPFKPAGTVNNFIFTYKPRNIIDSMAFMSIKYDNVSVEKLHKDLAQYYISKGNYADASREYYSLACMHPLNKSYYYYSSDYALKAAEYESAVRILKGMPRHQKNIYAQYTLASAFHSQKKYDEAIAAVNNLLKLKLDQKESLSALKLKYKILQESGMNSEAEFVLASLKKLDPASVINPEAGPQAVMIPYEIRSYIERATMLRRNGKINEAVNVLLEANKIRETAYSNLLIGKMLSSAGDLSAVYYLEKAGREFRDDPSLAYNLTLLYLMKSDFKKAETAMAEFARISGKNNAQYSRLQQLFNEQLKKKSGEPKK